MSGASAVQKYSLADVLQNRCQACNFTKKRLQHRCFPMKFAKLLRTCVLKNFCDRPILDMFFTNQISLPCKCNNSPFDDMHHKHKVLGLLRIINDKNVLLNDLRFRSVAL